MKSILKRKQVRMASLILAVIFGVLSVCSCAVVYITSNAGLYTDEDSFERTMKNKREYLQSIYSYWILYSKNNPNSDMAHDFSDSNMKYVLKKNGEVIGANCNEEGLESPYITTFEEGDLYDPMAGVSVPLEMHNNVLNIISYDNSFVFYDREHAHSMEIKEVLFSKKEGRFYINFGGIIIPLNQVQFSYESSDGGGENYSGRYRYDKKKGHYYAKITVDSDEIEGMGEGEYEYEESEHGKSVTISKNVKFETAELKDWEYIHFADFGFTELYCELDDVTVLSEIGDLSSFVDEKAEISGVFRKDSEYAGGRYEWDDCFLKIYSPDALSVDWEYTVLTEIKPYDDMEEGTADVFRELESLMNALYNMRYVNILIAISGILLCLFNICLYGWHILSEREDEGRGQSDGDSTQSRGLAASDGNVMTAGRKNSFIRKCPFEIYFMVSGTIIMFALSALSKICNGLAFIPNDSVSRNIWVCILLTACAFVMGITFIGEMCARYRDEVFLENTVTCTGLKFIRKKLNKMLDIIREHLSLFVKMTIFIVIFSGAELMVIYMTQEDVAMEMIIWLVWKLLEIPIFFKLAVDIRRLQDKAKSVADGNATDSLDTEKMWWELKKHGDYLNKIEKGVELAVQKQIKSERMRTELITNVSHDIKTPLTSIINYAGLMQKDGVGEEDKAQYLEVLNRKSAELKKLIEDLIEASKASTGNISVDLQRCDVGVLMVQVLGEFEEKLEDNELKLVMGENVEPIGIMADRRHLWRVFDNLMNNICKYSQPGTRVYIDVETDETGDNVRIIFKNTSKYPLNISGDELMERFVRGDSSRHTDGNGLGLAIAQSLAELMEGTVNITVDGDLFKVTLIFPVSKKTDAVMEYEE